MSSAPYALLAYLLNWPCSDPGPYACFECPPATLTGSPPLPQHSPNWCGAYIPKSVSHSTLSSNKRVVEAHMAAEPAKAAEYISEDFEWIEWADGVPPGGVRTRGKAAFVQSFGDDVLRDDILRVIGEGNVVVVEGIAHVTKKDGKRFDVQFCNIFELENGKIRRKSSFGALLKEAT